MDDLCKLLKAELHKVYAIIYSVSADVHSYEVYLTLVWRL